jgi:hypothetical protein
MSLSLEQRQSGFCLRVTPYAWRLAPYDKKEGSRTIEKMELQNLLVYDMKD